LKTYTAGLPTFTFPIGDGVYYSPVNLGFTVNGAGNVGFRVLNDEHPDNSGATDFIERYFISTSTIGTPYTYNISLGYANDDINGSESNMLLSRWNGSSWTAYSSTVGSNAIVSATGALTNVSAPLAATNHFTARTASVYYYRSVSDGLWSDASTWEVDTDPSFSAPVAASEEPTSINSAMIWILAGDTVTYNVSATSSNLIVQGTLQNTTTSVGTITATGTITFESGSEYIHNRDGGAFPMAVWDVASNSYIIGVTSNMVTSPQTW